MATHKFDPAKIDKLLDPERVAPYTAASFVKELCGLKEGMTFLDVGAGAGFFTKPAVELACPGGPKGKVIVVDTEPIMIAEINDRVKSQCLTIIQSDEYDFKIDDNIADITLMAFIIHEVEDKARFLKESIDKTKTGGHIVILDWEKIDEDKGPPKDHRVSRSECEEFIKDSGLGIIESKMINKSHYFIKALKS